MSEMQTGFLSPEQPPEAAPDAQEEKATGKVVFETTIAIKGGVMGVELVEDAEENMSLVLKPGGGLRKTAPIIIDRFQLQAFMAVVEEIDCKITLGTL